MITLKGSSKVNRSAARLFLSSLAFALAGCSTLAPRTSNAPESDEASPFNLPHTTLTFEQYQAISSSSGRFKIVEPSTSASQLALKPNGSGQ